MINKSKKVLASATILSLVMSTVAMAAPTSGTPVSGSSRVDTAIAIAKQAYSKWTDSKVAVIANGADAHLVDALTVAPLAAQKKAPILLTLGTSTLEDSVISALKAQGVTSVYIVGGTVTSAVDGQLKAAGVSTVTHLAGATRFETAQAINKELEGIAAPTAYAVVNTNASVADALSIAAEAAKQNIEIVLATDANNVPVDLAGKKVYAIGGTGVLSDALVTKLNATRLGGDTRFATNAAVLKGLDANLDYTTTYVADGTDAHLVDSLPGSVLASQTASPIVLVNDSVDSSVVDVIKGKTSKITTVTPLGGAVSAGAVAIIVNPNSTNPTGALAVSSVAATAANTIKVVFNQAPADTSKVAFTVNRGTTPITVTTTWNGSEATLTYSSNFPMGDYTVTIKNDTTDLGSSKLTIDQEKVAKIEVSTDKFATLADGKTGYFTYRVLNQYGNDITNTKSTSITWTVPGADSTSDSTGTKGVITATVGSSNQFNFLNLGSISITGVDNSDNIVVTKTLSVSASAGTLSDFKLLSVTQADNKELQVGDTTTVWNISYQAKDLAGNDTTNFTLLNGGLIDQDGTTNDSTILLNTSGYIQAKVVDKDGKGVIELRVTSTDALTTDLPVTVTAITKNGTTSTLNLTLKKKAQVDKLDIFAPTEDVAYGDAKEVPFTAYDQNGNQITKFDDIVDSTALNNPYVGQNRYTASKYSNVNLSPIYTEGSGVAVGEGEGFFWVKRGDDTAKLMYQAPKANGATTDVTKTLTASTNTGKFSSVTINIRKTAAADNLSVNEGLLYTRLTNGAYEKISTTDVFTAKDQYGRAVTLDGIKTWIKAEIVGTGNSVAIVGNTTGTIVADAANNKGDLNNDIFIKGTTTPGTTTIKFSLMKAGQADAVATKTVDFTTVKLGDISGIAIDSAIDSAILYDIYQIHGTTSAATAETSVSGKYVNSYTVFGLDSNGNKVLLPQTQSFQLSTSNSDLYKAIEKSEGGGAYTSAGDFNKISLGAWADKDTSSTVVTASTVITDESGNTSVKSTSATIKQSKEIPVAQSIISDDEIDSSEHSTGDCLADAITVKDQYGKNMLGRNDDSVKIYVNTGSGSALVNDADPDYATTVALSTLVGARITVVANNGKSITVTVK